MPSMGAALSYFMLPQDERALFRLLARREVTLYPELVPPGYAPLAMAEELQLDGENYYLALERLGPVVVHPVKRGPDRGMLAVEEIPSPVFHYERSLANEKGELVSGRIGRSWRSPTTPAAGWENPTRSRRSSSRSRACSRRPFDGAIPRASGWGRTRRWR